MKRNTGPTELDTFLPGDSVNKATKYEINSKIDVEAVKALNGEYDPFETRILDHPVSDCDTLTHLLKASLGTGILAMPAAFNGAGLVLGIFATILVAIICTHCSYILVSIRITHGNMYIMTRLGVLHRVKQIINYF
ncbi:Amino acid transporter [Oryctes borbonicus]|uniref:Amino acid transporter n=1 Tax=Oryctes borbonicus TaxID=1629725 RepID=A0A0T6BEI1_9SCAR|nr:Amino acid transporter [Oryctes borbonicus]